MSRSELTSHCSRRFVQAKLFDDAVVVADNNVRVVFIEFETGNSFRAFWLADGKAKWSILAEIIRNLHFLAVFNTQNFNKSIACTKETTLVGTELEIATGVTNFERIRFAYFKFGHLQSINQAIKKKFLTKNPIV